MVQIRMALPPPSPCPPGYDGGMDRKKKPIISRLDAIAMLAVTAAIAGKPFVPEIGIGAGVILGIVGCLNWLCDPP